MTDIQISRATQAIAARIREVNPELTGRQALRRAVWLAEQARAVDEQLQDFHQQRQQDQGDRPTE